MKNKRLPFIFLAVAVLLIIPIIAMQITDEVDWSQIDFVIVGFLLIGTGLIIDLVIRKTKNIKYRIAISVFLLLALFFIWTELAVGIFH